MSDKKKKKKQLPSWIPDLAGAAFGMYTHPNNERKMGRQNADPLVGLPDSNQRNYSAAGSRNVIQHDIRFKNRHDSYSMYVSGFVLDKVDKVEVASQGGCIPKEWVTAVGWDDMDDDPPQEFWRILVANRGRRGQNPPTYYARACKESIFKGLESGSLDTSALINDGRCSEVAEYFRRVQAVIWNRSLMRTMSGHLGIVRKDVKEGDLVCILYGCSVPVILRGKQKTPTGLEEELKELEAAAMKIQRCYRERRYRRAQLRERQLAKQEQEEEAKQDGAYSSKGETMKQMNPIDEEKTEPKRELEAGLTPNPKPKPDADLKPKLDVIDGAAGKTSKQKPGVAPHPVYYEFFGECYVHGMMDGEAIKYQNDKQVPKTIFELR